MRKTILFLSALIQYIRIRSRNKSELKQNDLTEICNKKPFAYANNHTELQFILHCLRPIARRISKDNICLDLSLVLINMSSIPAQIHFSVKKYIPGYIGHAWVEADSTILSTDYSIDHESFWSWEKSANVF